MRTVFRIFRSPLLLLLMISAGVTSPLSAQNHQQTPALGIVAQAKDASVDNVATLDGASIFSADYLSTDDNGVLLVRVGPLSLQLEPSSAVHIYRAPYGAVVELNRGSVVYTTPGGNENLVIVAADIRVTPDTSLPDAGRVSLDNPCEVTVYSQRGQANVQSGKESHLIEESKAYHVRAENHVSYREYLSPDDADYHRHHQHEPCAALEMVHGQAPLAPLHSHFALAAATAIGVGAGIGAYKVFESPSRP